MEEKVGSPAEVDSAAAYMSKKRKSKGQLLGMPSSKHVCWGLTFEYDSSADSSTEPDKAESTIFPRVGKSDEESAKDSNSFHGDADSVMSPYEDANTYFSYPTTYVSCKASTSSASWGGPSSEIDPFSLESRSMGKSSSKKPKPTSISEELDCLDHGYGFYHTENYEDHLLEFGSRYEYENDCTEQRADKDLDDLLYSNGVAPGTNYVLSSGRWSVNQDAQPGTRKLTIDKEFEQYFSTLMM